MAIHDDVLIINMNEHPVECFVCGESAPSTLGIPIYEDIILHNDWDGEWFGQSACQRCFNLQNELNKPMGLDQFRRQLDESNTSTRS